MAQQATGPYNERRDTNNDKPQSDLEAHVNTRVFNSDKSKYAKGLLSVSFAM